VLHFDGKIWRTLPLLFWHPGDLTRRYVHGERAKFVSPLALFLFTVFLTFAAFNWIAPKDIDANPVVSVAEAQEQYLADRQEILDDIGKLEAKHKVVTVSSKATNQQVARQLATLRERLTKLDEGRGKQVRRAENAALQFQKGKGAIEAEIVRLEKDLSAARKAGQPTERIQEELEGARLSVKFLGGAAEALSKSNDKPLTWNFTDLNFPGAASLNAAMKHASENPQLLLYKMQSSAYKYSWALIPISVPFVWLLFFWKRRFKMFDHAVFVTYSLTFMMMLGILCGIMIQFTAAEALAGLALAFIPPVHMYRQIRHAYGTTRLGAVWRTCLLTMFAMTALTMFAMLIVTLGVAG
ncbi:MAG: DUF3667 domain-containing protein, partial [Sphingorhabdus sp.]